MAFAPLMAIPEKKTVCLNLYTPLRDYIASNKSKGLSMQMEEHLLSLKRMRPMREDVEKGCDMKLEARRDLMEKYYRALCVMESTLPAISFCFTWYDSFNKNQSASDHNIHLEKAAIVFNLAAIHSQIAVSADSYDEACNEFQAAAGAFVFLRENISVKATSGNSTLDVSVECVDMLEKVMLAQAQECLFHKFISNNNPDFFIAMVAWQISIYYQEAYIALNFSPLHGHFEMTCNVAHLQLKAALFAAEASYRCSLFLHQKKEIGEEIARLKDGLMTLTNAMKRAEGLVGLAPILKMAIKLEGDIDVNLKRATEENETIYFQTIPALDTLPPLPTAVLVKSKPMDACLDANDEIALAKLKLGADIDLDKYQDQAAQTFCSIQ